MGETSPMSRSCEGLGRVQLKHKCGTVQLAAVETSSEAEYGRRRLQGRISVFLLFSLSEPSQTATFTLVRTMANASTAPLERIS